ncbi:hypothetical protein LUZ60_004411 [Juncus effusus]|nr:hypothetical protein LUZ60_004411 [Juncus effusus]
MGKNQAYKAMQRARVGSASAGPKDSEDGMADGSFHSPEWHAARLASLHTSHTITWEEYKRKQKEDEIKNGEVEADKDRMMREYRAQLDKERAQKLAHGRNHSHRSSSRSKKERKDKDSKKRSKRKRKHRRSTESSSSESSDSESSSSESEEEERESKRSRSKKSRKEKRKHRSRSKTKHSSDSSDNEKNEGPVPLSKFFGTAKD